MQSGKGGISVKPVILVGGKSERFGADKAFLSVNGKSVLERTYSVLKDVFRSEPLLVGRSRLPGFDAVEDAVPGAGPLGGLYTAFLKTDAEFVFLTACDMPFIDKRLVEAMYAELRAPCEVFVPKFGDFIEPLFAFYNRNVKNELKNLVSDGRYPVREIVFRSKACYFEESKIRKYDPELLSFLNINTKEDFDKLKKHI